MRDLHNRLLAETGLPGCGAILFHRTDADMPMTVE
jgi:hypothetical protein